MRVNSSTTVNRPSGTKSVGVLGRRHGPPLAGDGGGSDGDWKPAWRTHVTSHTAAPEAKDQLTDALFHKSLERSRRKILFSPQQTGVRVMTGYHVTVSSSRRLMIFQPYGTLSLDLTVLQ